MKLCQELKKLRRTGYYPALFLGALLAASFPILNTAIRPEHFIYLQQPALDILMDVNWQMLAMLNLMFVVVGACILYHTEFTDHAMQKMETLPQHIGCLFAAKTVLLALSLFVFLAAEGISFAFCAFYWFGADHRIILQLFLDMGYAFVLILPSVVLMMLLSSLCENLWVSLGIGIIGIFLVTMLPTDRFALALFPFAMPFQSLAKTYGDSWAASFLFAAGIQTFAFSMAETILLSFRRRLA